MHIPVTIAALALAACSTSTPTAPAPAPAPAPDAWLGQWDGPEGTSLKIEAKPGSAGVYALTITDLDGPETFEGRAEADTITFTRGGTPETLRRGDGEATGMKWLADKDDCLLVKAGEGWCRD